MNCLVFLGKVFFKIFISNNLIFLHTRRVGKTFINLYRKINKHEKFTLPKVRFFFAIPRVVKGIAYFNQNTSELKSKIIKSLSYVFLTLMFILLWRLSFYQTNSLKRFVLVYLFPNKLNWSLKHTYMKQYRYFDETVLILGLQNYSFFIILQVTVLHISIVCMLCNIFFF